MAKVLYLSYDGLSDPLGQSQVLPYLRGLRRLGHEMHLVSFEKAARVAPVRGTLTAAVLADGIVWHSLRYTKYPPVGSTIWDLLCLQRKVERLHAKVGFEWIHCRSYVPSIVGLKMKRQVKTRFLFDMRGFWPDEKVEAGTWNLRNPLYRTVYNFFKAKEADFVAEADAIVSLTHAGRKEIERWRTRSVRPAPIAVIPCATDFDVFIPQSAGVRASARAELGVPRNSLVVSYLGSLGTWYLLKEMLDWYSLVRQRCPGSRFLFVTPDSQTVVGREATARGIDAAEIIVVSATRPRIPFYLSASDVGVFFIRPTYSKRSSSPTKLGEYLAMGIPVVTNAGIGDVDDTVRDLEAGVIVPEFSADAYRQSIERLPALTTIDRHTLRERSRKIFDLQASVADYDRLYRQALC